MDRVLYRKVHARLLEEFSPETFTQRALVAGLAGDYVSLAKARKIVEAAMTPPASPDVDTAAVERYKQNRRWKRLLDFALESVEGRFAFAARDAGDLVMLVTGQLDALNNVISLAAIVEEVEDIPTPPTSGGEEPPGEPKPVVIAGTPSDPEFMARHAEHEQREVEEARAVLKRLEPSMKRLENAEHLTAVLTGRRRASRADLERLRLLLARARKEADLRVMLSRDAVQKVMRQETGWRRQLSERPEWLLLMQRYVTRIEGIIERKVRHLQKP